MYTQARGQNMSLNKLKALILLGLFVSGAFADGDGHLLTSDSARYVFGKTSLARADQFMLDTKTGRMWQIQVDSMGIQTLGEIRYEKWRRSGDTLWEFKSALPFAPDTVSTIHFMESPVQRPRVQEVRPEAPKQNAPADGGNGLGIFLGTALAIITVVVIVTSINN